MKTTLVINAGEPEVINVNCDTMPSHDSNSMCRILINCINRYFEDPKIKAEYDQWKREQTA